MPEHPSGSPDELARQASGVVTQAVEVASWLNRAGWVIARRLPGGVAVERTVRPVEQAVADEVRRRLRTLGLLDRPDGVPQDGIPVASVDQAPTGAVLRTGQAGDRQSGDRQVGTAARPVREELEPLRAAMAELLSRSVEQTREQSEQQLFAGLIRQLVPDEARILAALSDGSRYPLVHVASRGPLGGVKRLVLENASTVGRAAGVRLAAHTAAYVTHLLRLGLVDLAPEDRALADQYEILMADDLVLAAQAQARIDGRGGVRVIRQTLALSELGSRFWDACHPTGVSLPARWP